MADRTTHLGLNLPLGTESADMDVLNGNFQTLDTEVFRRGKSINGVEVNSDGDFVLSEVPFARQIVSDTEQKSSGEYLFRTTGGDASLSDGDATLVSLTGRRRHDGVIAEVLDMTVHNATRSEGVDGITAELDRATFISYVGNPASTTLTISYTNAWSINPTLAGVTVTGTPIDGDSITISYVRASRGTIVQSSPSAFRSTGWNLYNNTLGYARVKKYSETYGFIVGGAYTKLQYSATESGVRSDITVSGGNFTVPGDGYVWVTGGNNTTTYIMMTWSDWTSGYEGDWAAYTEDSISLSTVMTNCFPYGLCQVGSVSDEIDLSTQRAIRRIERTAYSAETAAAFDNDGIVYEADTSYIYYVLAESVITGITQDKTYAANDHGLEIIDASTDVAPLVMTLYGENLVDKLRTDVLTISAQTLEASQKAQARTNIGAADADDLDDVVNLLKYKDLGSFSTESALATALDAELDLMAGYTQRAVRFNLTAVTTAFTVNYWYGTLAKTSTSAGASLLVMLMASSGALTVSGSKNNSWVFWSPSFTTTGTFTFVKPGSSTTATCGNYVLNKQMKLMQITFNFAPGAALTSGSSYNMGNVTSTYRPKYAVSCFISRNDTGAEVGRINIAADTNGTVTYRALSATSSGVILVGTIMYFTV